MASIRLGCAVLIERRLDRFTGSGYDKGRGMPWLVAWYATQHLLFGPFWCPARLRPVLLRLFGASVGRGVHIRRGVRVHLPWKLSIGSHVWIGEGAWLLNLEQITVGNHVCVSQEAVLCTGSHDRRSPSMEFDNAAITLQDHSWVAVRSIVLRGVTVGRGAL